MNKYAKIGFSGLLVSFLGALPLGTLNITAFDIAASQSLVSAIWFAVAVVLVELIVVRLTLFGNEKLQFGEKMSNYLIPFGIILLLYLAVTSFMASTEISEMGSRINVLPQISSAFWLGFLLSALNPLHIPFWMTWNKVLSSRGILETSRSSYTLYILGIGVGSLLGIGLFIFAGKYIFTNYESYSMLTNLLMGLLYLGFSIYLMFLLVKKRLKLKTQ
ncbi:LysE family transporter [Flagellimonas sp. S3867]|uniref:LysE family transporter n=1 Tax=Flagellimonas sp. S3867 TaxID=2768063 RepID=UPI0016853E55|nr:LysE family transporter [Flagellimonas sp. S3867]